MSQSTISRLRGLGAPPLCSFGADRDDVLSQAERRTYAQLLLSGRPPHLTAGAHRVSFRNANATHGAVYLANALLPEDRRIAITDMQHAMDQSGLTIAFTVRP